VISIGLPVLDLLVLGLAEVGQVGAGQWLVQLGSGEDAQVGYFTDSGRQLRIVGEHNSGGRMVAGLGKGE
jgi:hypothetical protein